jgi:hypothetical protein
MFSIVNALSYLEKKLTLTIKSIRRRREENDGLKSSETVRRIAWGCEVLEYRDVLSS